MNSAEKWVIKNANGQLLQSFLMDPEQIRINWFDPDAPGKTKAGQKGPLNLQSKAKAEVLQMALASLVPAEFAESKVMTFPESLGRVNNPAS